ncbi:MULTISPECIES: EAL domain-containing protein [Halomonadaceae]|uniref:EAL domain-containing protein n=1 Tax=Vreelandella halophila TaxID=86177 RepID=A0A9X5B566_9GAMM|nr:MULTISPECIES: EAL domain-containing protein [Halomonas]MYL26098.1 EAL domain-containing protein [Halomonas utahensis]MYL73340.1 EAL domain-containing protein [Halomonas sp. 22501_18_FS]
MTMEQKSSTLLSDLAEAVFQVFDVVCAAVIVEGHESPVDCAGDQSMGQRLVQLAAVRSALADALPRTEEPPGDGTMDEAAVLAVEPLGILPDEPATVLAFAMRHSADLDRAVALAHALATETASQLTVVRQAPFLASALAEVECGVTVSNPNLEDSPLIYVNDAFTRLTGYTRAETLGRNCRFLQGHLQDQPGIQSIRSALARGVDCTTVLTNIRRNGEAFQNRLRLRPIRTSDGTISHVIGIQEDVTREQSALESLDLQKRRYESLIESGASYIWHMNAEGEVQSVDPAWLALAGLPPSSETPELATIRNALEPEAAATYHHRWVEALQTVEPFEVVYQLPAGSESPRWFQDRFTPVHDDDGHLLEWFGVSQEITALKDAEQDLDRIIQAAPTGMLVVERDGTITLANAQASRLFGHSVDELTGMAVEALVPEASRHKHEQLRTAYSAEPSIRRMGVNREVRGVRKDGTEFDAEVGLSWFGHEHQLRVVAAINDNTELNNARKAVERAAYQDRLTGLLSREGFAWKLDELRSGAGLHPASLIVSIDISGLREINNAQGYVIGDQVLEEAARRLAAEVGESNLVARPGGGEFLVLVAVDRQHTPARWRQRLEAVFNAPFEVGGFVLFISVSFGYVRIGSAAREAQALMNDAELALRQSQQNLSVTWTQYTRVLERQTRATVATTHELRQAIERDELMLYYQPKVDLASGAVVAAEALLRWQHAHRGFIAPGDFIPLAEQSQLIGPIGEWVLRQACSDLRAWQDAGLDVRPVSVNMSLVQFQLGFVPDIVEKALTDFGIDPHQLTLEITESVFEEHSDLLKEDLRTLSAMGVKLSLDDFGTGYSSLSYLKDYPFDEIKIDKSFVWQLDDGAYGRAIVKAVDAIAVAIGAQIVAEGVESAHHGDVLKELGCTLGQGFYYNRPLPESQWRQLLSL